LTTTSVLDPAANINAGTDILANAMRTAGGDPAIALAAYNGGSKNNNASVGMSPKEEAYVRSVANYYRQHGGDPAKVSVVPSAGGDTPRVNSMPRELDSLDIQRPATDFSPVEGSNIDNATYDSLFPDIVVSEGLDETPWYDDPGLLTGNVHGRSSVQPVVFEVMLRNKGNVFLSDSKGSPLQIQLNASMKNFTISSKHAFHEERSRTAFHITLWGMNADTIEGSCTTGVFMNQFGLTDFFSVADVSDDLKTLVTSGALFRENELTNDGAVTGRNVTALSTFDTLLAQRATQNPQAAFRVAAQDAFVEFLSLFKMNGNVWFYNKDYQVGGLVDHDQQSPSAWSPQTGTSSTQTHARNNDVMTRGYVTMKLRANTYLGYFKSLSWTIDAKNPYQWNFNFVFQVERTINILFQAK
jgi:hypothetical protein